MPLAKQYTDTDGYLYLEFALATTDLDLENEQLTDNCLKSMVEQAKNINIYLSHQYGIEDTIGPVTDSWIENNQLWVKGRCRKKKEADIKDLLDSETRMGGSFGGICTKDTLKHDRRMLDEVKLLDATFTPMPVNTATSGTAKLSFKECSVCSQIVKSISKKYFQNPNGESDMAKRESESFEELKDKINTTITEQYTDQDHGCWIKLTFSDSVIAEIYSYSDYSEMLYEIPYKVNESGEIELGDPIEVEEQYVAKRMTILDIKDFNEIPNEIKEFINNRGEIMALEAERKEELETFGKSMGQEIVLGLKEIIKPEETKEPEEEKIKVKSIDEDAIAEKASLAVLKALGIEPEPEEEPETGKILVMDAKAFEEMNQKNITKAVLEIGKQNKGTRKSISLGGSKFENPEVIDDEEKSVQKGGKVSTKKASELLLTQKGIGV